tara:strand:- start:2865 stop:3413 length:549 start_codon:yes stop_codon:yes gene_type:complete
MVLTQSAGKLNRGDKAPDFTLKGVDGKTYSLSDVSDKEGLLVLFMCNHCPYVKAKMDTIVKLQEKWGDRVDFVGINSNDPEYEGEGMDNMKVFAKEWNMRFPYLLDETQEMAKTYGATCTPDPFLFDKEQKLVFHGRIDDALEPGQEVTENTMAENIQKLLSEEEIADELKPSMGCSIKWLS